jgi:hypothetical protein
MGLKGTPINPRYILSAACELRDKLARDHFEIAPFA